LNGFSPLPPHHARPHFGEIPTASFPFATDSALSIAATINPNANRLNGTNLGVNGGGAGLADTYVQPLKVHGGRMNEQQMKVVEQ
jgi:hypothetical protein